MDRRPFGTNEVEGHSTTGGYLKFLGRSYFLPGVQQNNIRSHALTAHPNEFQLAQENEEKYWSGTGAK